ncbi:MAG TPA: M1 family metallopeptidase [Chitinophagaceae bacterium]|nr:M1 family metallopeptidase [Chitinophagaceae bacterium]
MRTQLLVICSIVLFTATTFAQAKETMPAGTSPYYSWWNVLHYTIHITPDYTKKFLTGTNTIEFKALRAGQQLQIDLQEPMVITGISFNNRSLHFQKKQGAYIVYFPGSIRAGNIETISIAFEGTPHPALKPPFDNGWIWSTDKKGRPWVSVACEGSGASIWLPCKEAAYDEPDNGVAFTITVPDTLIAIANGRLQQKTNNANGTAAYTWVVKSTINNYDIIPYIGHYMTWHKNYNGIKGNLDCDYWVLDYNETKAQKHLTQVDTMLRCFEYWLGPYPFYDDSYKLVEAAMPGMEHQSAIAYGNGFENGYSGKNLSGTVWGLQWDFILVHESGHEWFGNSISAAGYGESWIHEGFTKYLETLYTEYVFGKTAGIEYTRGNWKRIKNDVPVIGSGSSDTYYKGSALLHMVRQVTGDTTFRQWLHQLNKVFYHHTVTTAQILTLLNNETKRDFTPMFNQYLQTTQIPTLAYYFKGNDLYYHWTNCVAGFNMPVTICTDGVHFNLIYPSTKWQQLAVNSNTARMLTTGSSFLCTSNKVK